MIPIAQTMLQRSIAAGATGQQDSRAGRAGPESFMRGRPFPISVILL